MLERLANQSDLLGMKIDQVARLEDVLSVADIFVTMLMCVESSVSCP